MRKDRFSGFMVEAMKNLGFEEYSLNFISREDTDQYVTIEVETDCGKKFTKTFDINMKANNKRKKTRHAR